MKHDRRPAAVTVPLPEAAWRQDLVVGAEVDAVGLDRVSLAFDDNVVLRDVTPRLVH
jgi:hypothetical protein